MYFSERVRGKLEARQRGEAPTRMTTAALREQARDRARPIQEGVERLVASMAEEPRFSAVFGPSPTIEFLFEPMVPSVNTIRVSGKAAFFSIHVLRQERFGEEPQTDLELEVVPEARIRAAIDCGLSFTDANVVKADARDLPAFLLRIEDMIAELLADIAVSDVGEQYARPRPDGG